MGWKTNQKLEERENVPRGSGGYRIPGYQTEKKPRFFPLRAISMNIFSVWWSVGNLILLLIRKRYVWGHFLKIPTPNSIQKDWKKRWNEWKNRNKKTLVLLRFSTDTQKTPCGIRTCLFGHLQPD